MNKGRWVFEPSTDPQVEDDNWVLSGSVYSVQVAGPREYIVNEFHEAEEWGRDHGVFKTLKAAMARAEALADGKKWDPRMNGRFLSGMGVATKKRKLSGADPHGIPALENILQKAKSVYGIAERFLWHLDAPDIERVYLYGSVPQGRATSESDIDIRFVGEDFNQVEDERQEQSEEGRLPRLFQSINSFVDVKKRPGSVDASFSDDPPPEPWVLLFNSSEGWVDEKRLKAEIERL